MHDNLLNGAGPLVNIAKEEQCSMIRRLRRLPPINPEIRLNQVSQIICVNLRNLRINNSVCVVARPNIRICQYRAVAVSSQTKWELFFDPRF